MSAELIVDRPVEQIVRRARHPRRLLLGVLLLAASLFLVDRWLQQREFTELSAQVAASQGAITYADGQVTGAIRYGTPQLFMQSTPAGVQIYLQGLVDEASRMGAGEVATAAAGVSAVSILPWHRSLIDARSTAAAYAQVWHDFLRTSLAARVETSDWNARLASGRTAAAAGLRSAIPPLDRGTDATHVAQIFGSQG